jgi:hypothetical protein
MNDAQSLESRLANAAVAPRITLLDVEDNIKEVQFLVVFDVLTICVLKLQNGFTVTGESACASPENFNKEIGEDIARKNAVAKIWALMGYELRSKLQLLNGVEAPSFPEGRTYLGTKVVHAYPLTRAAYNKFRGWTLPADEDGTDEGYLVEYADGGKPNVEGVKGYVSWSPKEVFERAYK